MWYLPLQRKCFWRSDDDNRRKERRRVAMSVRCIDEERKKIKDKLGKRQIKKKKNENSFKKF